MNSRSCYHKLFDHPLKKVFAILWAIWAHRNEVMFKGSKPNSIIVVGKCYYRFSYTVLYNTKTNIISWVVSSGNHQYRTPKKFVKPIWKPPSMELLKWNTNASRITDKNSTSIGVLCRHNKGRIMLIRLKSLEMF